MRTDQDIGSCRDELLAPDPRALVLDELAPGVVVGGKYRVDRELGRGAMGVVLAATHTGLDEPVALKFLSVKGEAAPGESLVERFKREARVNAKLRNEHIARVTDVDLWRDGVFYMVMELLEGAELAALLGPGKILTPEVAVGYIVQVCDGLAEAHGHGIIHRDLKPGNLFLVRRPDGTELVKILDFGVSKSREGDFDDPLTQTGVVLGTPKYMAPEQLFAAGAVDARADVFSLGAVLFYCLTGQPPFNEGNFAKLCSEIARGAKPSPLREIAPHYSQKLEAALTHALDVDRSLRTANVAELAYELLEAIGDPRAEAERDRLQTMLEGNAKLRATGSFASSDSFTWTGGATSSMSGSRSAGPIAESASDPAPLAPSSPGKNQRLYVGPTALLVGALAVLLTRRPPPALEAASPSTAVVPPPSLPAATSAAASVAAATPAPAPSGFDPPSTIAVASAPIVAPAAQKVVQKVVRAPQSASKPQKAPVTAVPNAAPKPKKNPLEDRL